MATPPTIATCSRAMRRSLTLGFRVYSDTSLNPSPNLPISLNPSPNLPISLNPSPNSPSSLNPSPNLLSSLNPSPNSPSSLNPTRQEMYHIERQRGGESVNLAACPIDKILGKEWQSVGEDGDAAGVSR